MFSHVFTELVKLISPFQLGIILKVVNGNGNENALQVAVVVYREQKDGQVSEIGRETFQIDLGLL